MTRAEASARAIEERAARLGVPGPEKLCERTPREIERVFELYELRAREELRRI